MTEKEKKAEKRGFRQGVVYATALLIRCREEGGAETIWNESEYSLLDLRGCDPYDADKVREYFS